MNFLELQGLVKRKAIKIKGPILIFGAGGFIGVNLLKSLLAVRKDVYGVSSNPKNNWRFIENHIKLENLIQCDVTDFSQLRDIVHKIKPRSVINLSAYGAYSKQREYQKIYQTNFNSVVSTIEILKEVGFDCYIQAGSSSEYGLNSKAPKEESTLMPNSHYAVSKVAASTVLNYYGKIEKLPTMVLRIYSAFGPWEEPDRLIPTLLAAARKGKYPNLVSLDISRDFVYISDIIDAFIYATESIKPKFYGEVYNVATGVKTTIRDLTKIISRLAVIKGKPEFGSMENRNWDMKDWYGNKAKIKRDLNWEPKINVTEGLKRSLAWQESIGYDDALWNWTKP